MWRMKCEQVWYDEEIHSVFKAVPLNPYPSHPHLSKDNERYKPLSPEMLEISGASPSENNGKHAHE